MDYEATRPEPPASASKGLPMVRSDDDEVAAAAPVSLVPIEGFDFDRIPEQHRMLLKSTTNSIRERTRRMAIDAYHYGAQLLEVKSVLEHGLFQAWLEQAVRINPRTAERLMQVRRRIGGKIDSVSHLPITVLYGMTQRSVPDAVLASLLAQAEQLKLTPIDVENALHRKAKAAAPEEVNDALDLLRELINGHEDELRDVLTATKIRGIAAFLKALTVSRRAAKSPRAEQQH